MGRQRRDPGKAQELTAAASDAPLPAGLARFSEKPFAAAFRDAQAATGKSLAALAEATGYSRGYLSQVSREANGTRLTRRLVGEIAAALGVPADHFRDWREPRIEQPDLRLLARDPRAVPVLQELAAALKTPSPRRRPPAAGRPLSRDHGTRGYARDAFSETLGNRRGAASVGEQAVQPAGHQPAGDTPDNEALVETLTAIAQHLETSNPGHRCTRQCADTFMRQAEAALAKSHEHRQKPTPPPRDESASR